MLQENEYDDLFKEAVKKWNNLHNIDMIYSTGKINLLENHIETMENYHENKDKTWEPKNYRSLLNGRTYQISDKFVSEGNDIELRHWFSSKCDKLGEQFPPLGCTCCDTIKYINVCSKETLEFCKSINAICPNLELIWNYYNTNKDKIDLYKNIRLINNNSNTSIGYLNILLLSKGIDDITALDFLNSSLKEISKYFYNDILIKEFYNFNIYIDKIKYLYKIRQICKDYNINLDIYEKYTKNMYFYGMNIKALIESSDENYDFFKICISPEYTGSYNITNVPKEYIKLCLENKNEKIAYEIAKGNYEMEGELINLISIYGICNQKFKKLIIRNKDNPFVEKGKIICNIAQYYDETKNRKKNEKEKEKENNDDDDYKIPDIYEINENNRKEKEKEKEENNKNGIDENNRKEKEENNRNNDKIHKINEKEENNTEEKEVEERKSEKYEEWEESEKYKEREVEREEEGEDDDTPLEIIDFLNFLYEIFPIDEDYLIETFSNMYLDEVKFNNSYTENVFHECTIKILNWLVLKCKKISYKILKSFMKGISG